MAPPSLPPHFVRRSLPWAASCRRLAADARQHASRVRAPRSARLQQEQQKIEVRRAALARLAAHKAARLGAAPSIAPPPPPPPSRPMRMILVSHEEEDEEDAEETAAVIEEEEAVIEDEMEDEAMEQANARGGDGRMGMEAAEEEKKQEDVQKEVKEEEQVGARARAARRPLAALHNIPQPSLAAQHRHHYQQYQQQ